ncbi:MFS transporter [Kineococcus rubinsiae]|uniref:MFS transporter n=1 Tax=Kineococcus rubinsiae TaxID=2609562 RepID=UPI00142FC96C|nr:MFS transporter [Kineococcus rubinsiae]NIZ93442.1 MFS transporter [Kineococcus rubinsiae]
MSTATAPSRDALRARTAVYASFTLNGFALASWIARIPSARDALGLSLGDLGLLLLAGSIGSVATMPAAGALVMRFGRVRTVTAGGAAVASGLLLVALAVDGLATVWPAAVGLVVVGAGIATWDVAMNVEGAAVERRLDRAIMSRFHAAFSFGTVLAAGLAVLLLRLGVPTWVHLCGAAALAAVGSAGAARAFLRSPSAAEAASAGQGIGLGRAWREPRTLLIGLMVLCMAFVEGSASDWLAVGLGDGYGTSHDVGVAGFAVFVAAMTTGRLLGPVLLERFGRVAALRGCAALAVAGVLLFVLAPSVPLAVVGAAAWGVGASLGFPLGMSAAADEEVNAAARVSVVSSVGYAAFLAGPPLLGQLGDRVGVLTALLAAAVAAAVALVLSGVARPHADGTALSSERTPARSS